MVASAHALTLPGPAASTLSAAAYCPIPSTVVCTQERSSKSTLELFGPTGISALLVILGWIVVNQLQANRERRKQARDQIENLALQVTEIEALAVAYHTKDRDQTTERDLITKLGRFEKSSATLTGYEARRWWRLPAFKKGSLKVSPESIQQMRKAMTLNHFADEHVVAVPEDHELVQDLQAAVDNVIASFERCRLSALD